MKAGKYSIKELFSNKNIESIIVPEIQRDYVWGKKQVEGLLFSIFDDFKNFEESNNQITVNLIEDRSFEKTILEYYKSIKFNTNIGFIYAYSDYEYPDKYFLIDGQQRLTTIYLLLCALASLDENFKTQFNKLYFKNSQSFIEYRVREASLQFLNHSISHSINNTAGELNEQYWYYNFYENDKTIQSIVQNLKTITQFLNDKIADITSFKEYILNHVQFWYFDTNISEQGEELYIYMNARGEKMQSNENLKAELLSSIPNLIDKNVWGTKWENWQDLFWLIRGKHENADNVFNEFIYCIAGLENQKRDLKIIKEVKDKHFEMPNHIELLKCFESEGLLIIENYVKVLKLLISEKLESYCIDKGIYYQWLIKYRNLIISLLNSDYTNWFANIKDQNRNTERNRMVGVWSALNVLLQYIDKEIDDNLIISLRIFYNRYYNFVRSVEKNISESTLFSKEGYREILETKLDSDDESISEELLKYNYIVSESISSDFYEKISTIWELEDHPINLNGRDVGNINSSHLIDYKSSLDLNTLRLIKYKFFELIPINDVGNEVWDNYSKLLNCLITYGKCWNAKVTNGYDNLDFDNERRIVRDIDSEKDKCFNKFFKDFINTDSFDDLFEKVIVEIEYDKETEDWVKAIQWYNYHLKEKMWLEGYYIASGGGDYWKKDKYFPNFYQFVNTKGNYNGGSPNVLSKNVKFKTN